MAPAQESGLRENCTSRLSERAEAGESSTSSDSTAVKSPNKAGSPAAEAVEPRAGTKGNVEQQSTHRTQTREHVTQALNRVRSGLIRCSDFEE